MGTRSKTTIFDENGKPLLSFYRQMDGYFEDHGQDLQDFLSEMVVVNGYGTNTPSKAANGMGCLAAQLIAHFKNGIGGIYICNHNDKQEFNYEIRLAKPIPASLLSGPLSRDAGRLTLVGRGYDETKTFPCPAPYPS